MWKTRPWQSYDSKKVYDYLAYKFRGRAFIKHTNFVAPDIEHANMGATLKDEYGKMVSGDNAQQRAFAEYLCYYHNIDAYYNAVTRNPKDIDLNGMIERDVDPSTDNQHLQLMTHMGRIVSCPFRFVDKSWVLKQYKRLGIEDLFSLTRSCERDIPGIDYTNYTPGQLVPTCGECFWCKERAWAIEQTK
jgi:hypothetical protein